LTVFIVWKFIRCICCRREREEEQEAGEETEKQEKEIEAASGKQKTE
jgi:hypothetical protein